MARVTAYIRVIKSWWVDTALWLAYPICLFSERAANRYCAWLFDKGLSFRVR